MKFLDADSRHEWWVYMKVLGCIAYPGSLGFSIWGAGGNFFLIGTINMYGYVGLHS